MIATVQLTACAAGDASVGFGRPAGYGYVMARD